MSEPPQGGAKLAERSRLAAAWRGPHRGYDAEPFAHELVSVQAQMRPGAIALCYEGHRLTYGELEQRANALAHYLRSSGVIHDEPIALCLDRSPDLVVAMLAALKAGAAFMPLDPVSPSARLAALLRQVDARHLVGHTRTVTKLAAAASIHTTSLDAEWNAITVQNPDRPPAGRPHPDGLAYVLFTSGSTGVPKAAMNTHAGLRNRLCYFRDTLGTDERDVLVLKSPVTFDVAVGEVFQALTTGARLVIGGPEVHRDPWALADLLAQERVTLLDFVPSMLDVLTEIAPARAWETIRHVVSGGEELPVKLEERLLAICQAEVINAYGPTEATIDVTCSFGRSRSSGEKPPIGPPHANTHLYVLDDDLAPVPLGVPGELFVGGVQIGRGYLGDPALTAARFLPDPFDGSGARMYRTGDFVRARPNLELEFVGRADHQVKVGGVRIELGEIEAALVSLPGIRQAVASARGEGRDKRLVAYVVLDTSTEPERPLRDRLRDVLPPHLIPSAVIELQSLPLTQSGKVDRRALPDPGDAGGERADYEAPRSELERQVSDIFADVLGVDRVGRRDHFFALGGQSLLATKVVARIRALANVDLPLRSVFEAATVEALAGEVERLRGAERDAGPPLAPVPREGPLPLSYAQRRLYFLQMLDVPSPAYNVPEAWRLSGRLDAEALRRSVEAVVRRHEALRTVFPSSGGVPRQWIREPARWDLPVSDLSGLGEDARRAELERLSRHDAMSPFDLEAGPLLRTRLARLAHDEHVLFVTFHHIVTDGWSMSVFWRDLGALYAAYAQGKEAHLEDLPVQYADYAVWERSWLSGERLDSQLEFWKSQLAGAPDETNLPRKARRDLDVVRPSHEVCFPLDPGLTARLRALSRQRSATLFMTLQAALRALLYRYTGQADLCIGTPTANRGHRELEPLVGFFVNMLVMRAVVGQGESFAEILDRERETALEAYAHQAAPFEAVVDAVGIQRSLERHPLFQVAFVPETASAEDSALGPLPTQPVRRPHASRFDLEVGVVDRGNRIDCAFGYDAHLLDGLVVEQMAGHYERLLRAVVEDPGRRIEDVALLSDREQERMLNEWSCPGAARDAGDRVGAVPERVAAVASRSPDALAVAGAERRLSFEELDAQSLRVARHLRTLGAGTESRVAVLMRRSVDAIVAMLGVWRAGGAYVPLDPSAPAARSSYIVEDSGASIIVVARDSSAGLPGTGAKIISFESLVEDEPGTHAEALTTILGDSLAYILYTSGSTGTPKGVEIPHATLARLCETQRRVFALETADRVGQVAALTFDVSAMEIWSSLSAGASLFIPAEEDLSLPRNLWHWLDEEAITVCFVPTPLAEAMMQEEPPPGLALRCLQTAGDRLRRRPSEWSFDFYNLYGPTEITIWATMYRVEPGPAGQLPPIGRPVDYVRAYVLDDRLHPVPVGVVGELWIGGGGVGRGYGGRPGLTAERFMPDPFATEPGARMYRTGDLVRWLPDKNLDFLGRLDHQVKVRGYRIELGEIESVLSVHPSVRSCAVVAWDGPGGVELAAYVAGAEDELEVSALRDHLRAELPGYMVPAALVELSELPLSAAGKIDRKALPRPPEEAYATSAYVAPRSETEARIAAIWRELLGRDQVGALDHFFELGGHSVLLMRLLARIGEELGANLTLREAYEDLTVAGMAAKADRRRGGDDPLGLDAIDLQPGRPLEKLSSPQAPATFAQQMQWDFHRRGNYEAMTIQSALMDLRGAVDAAAMRRAVDALVARQESLRTRFFERDGALFSEVHEKGPELDILDLSRDGIDAARERVREMMKPLEPREEVFRAALMRVGDEHHVLALISHHIVMDGFSWGVLLDDLAALYGAYAAGRAPELQPLSLRLRDYAWWQTSLEQRPVGRTQMAFWTQTLADYQGLEIAGEVGNPARQSVGLAADTYEAGDLPVAFDGALWESLKAASRRLGVTPYDLCATAFFVLLAEWGEQPDVCVLSGQLHRNRPGSEAVVGNFVTPYPLRVGLNRDGPLAEAVEAVHRAALSYREHAGVAPTAVKDRWAEWSRYNFNYLIGDVQRGSLPGLEVTPCDEYRTPPRTAHDLACFVQQKQAGLAGMLVYNAERFSVAQAERARVRLLEIADHLVNRPAARVGDVRL